MIPHLVAGLPPERTVITAGYPSQVEDPTKACRKAADSPSGPVR